MFELCLISPKFLFQYQSIFNMKKNLLPIVLMAFIGLVTSFSGGRASGADEGNTGAPGDVMNGSTPLTCQFCHSLGAFSPLTMKIELYDSLGTTKLTSYLPTKVHTIRMTLTATGAPFGYGFQMIDLKKTGNTPVVGFLPLASQPSNVQVATTSAQSPTPNRTYAEHRGVSTSPIFNIKWRAPAKGAGAIVFYGAGTAVNGNQAQSGDGSTSTSQEFSEGTTATKDLSENVRFEVFSWNTDGVSLLLTSDRARSVAVRVSNLSGQIVTFDKWDIASGENIRTLNLGTARGAYLIQVIDNQTVITKKIIKF
jgi:hypothetical protein